MECPRCHSKNTQIQQQKAKNSFIVGVVLLFGGLGLMFVGPVGLIIGLVAGLMLGAILNVAVPNRYETVLICQNCGGSVKLLAGNEVSLIRRKYKLDCSDKFITELFLILVGCGIKRNDVYRIVRVEDWPKGERYRVFAKGHNKVGILGYCTNGQIKTMWGEERQQIYPASVEQHN